MIYRVGTRDYRGTVRPAVIDTKTQRAIAILDYHAAMDDAYTTVDLLEQGYDEDRAIAEATHPHPLSATAGVIIVHETKER